MNVSYYMMCGQQSECFHLELQQCELFLIDSRLEDMCHHIRISMLLYFMKI